jgi:hypothetical protein
VVSCYLEDLVTVEARGKAKNSLMPLVVMKAGWVASGDRDDEDEVT